MIEPLFCANLEWVFPPHTLVWVPIAWGIPSFSNNAGSAVLKL